MRKAHYLPSEGVNTTMDEWQSLANAIILQAVRDYRQAQKTILNIQKRVQNGVPLQEDECRKLHTKYDSAIAEIHRNEHFFTSRWFSVLTKADGTELLQRLRKEAA